MIYKRKFHGFRLIKIAGHVKFPRLRNVSRLTTFPELVKFIALRKFSSL